MIGKLTGNVDNINKDTALIDVMGVGYIVTCSTITLNKLPPKGEKTSLIIETYVREDQISLYGFYDDIEKYWFSELTKVKGVGPKLALTILGILTPAALVNALASQDKASFSRISGVGPKLIERIFAELKNHKGVFDTKLNVRSDENSPDLKYDIQNDTISALVNLGYSKQDAYQVTSKLINKNDNMNTTEFIKLALKELSR